MRNKIFKLNRTDLTLKKAKEALQRSEEVVKRIDEQNRVVKVLKLREMSF